MQIRKTRYEKGEITKQTLADRIQLLFTTNIQKQAKDILGEVSPIFPDPDKKQTQSKDEPLQNISDAAKTLKHDITQAIQVTKVSAHVHANMRHFCQSSSSSSSL
jgi:hypothetical protein